ncbi:hypothetical protein [Streptomyces sp. NPDC089799]|uniref:hypothetical protein n=1 Tax=Streptomyces sp. NPDC089799 TaxID=3155066 RepID=UPI0034316A82
MNTPMNTPLDTLLSYLAVVALAALVLGPALFGIARERRIGRQLREAQAAGRSVEGARASRVSGASRRAQKSSSRSTVPSTATW